MWIIGVRTKEGLDSDAFSEAAFNTPLALYMLVPGVNEL